MMARLVERHSEQLLLRSISWVNILSPVKFTRYGRPEWYIWMTLLCAGGGGSGGGGDYHSNLLTAQHSLSIHYCSMIALIGSQWGSNSYNYSSTAAAD